jgi:hypothetical protein
MDPLESVVLFLGFTLALAAVGAALFVWLRNAQVHRQSSLDNEVRRLGFERTEWDDTIRETVESLDIGSASDTGQGAIYHFQRSDANFFLIEGSLMSSSKPSEYQFSMLVTSPALGLPRMATIPKLQFEGLIGRLIDELIERIPMGALQAVELNASEPFRLFALSPIQARAFFDGWRIAQLTELSEGFVSCGGDAFVCNLVTKKPDQLRQTTLSGRINRVYEFAQTLLAGFVQ